MAVVTNEGYREGLEVALQSFGPFGTREGVVEGDGAQTVGGQGVIDFGNCFTGIGHSRVISIKNVTKSRLNVLLTSDAREDVRFYLHTDLQVRGTPLQLIHGCITWSKRREVVQFSRNLISQDEYEEEEEGDPPVSPGGVGGGEADAAAGGVKPSEGGASRAPPTGQIQRSHQANAEAGGVGGEGEAQSRMRNMQATMEREGEAERGEGEARQRRIEELDLLPDQRRSIVIWYCPSVASGAGEGGGYDKSLASLAIRQIHIALKATYPVDGFGGRGETFGMHSRKVTVDPKP